MNEEFELITVTISLAATAMNENNCQTAPERHRADNCHLPTSLLEDHTKALTRDRFALHLLVLWSASGKIRCPGPAYATDIKRSQKISAMPIGCYPSIYLMADASWISMEQWNPRKTSTTPALHFPNLLWSKDKQRLSRLARSLEKG